MAKLHMFVSNRDITVASLQGYAIEFKKGVPAHVPPAMHSEVLEKGILACDEQAVPTPLDQMKDPRPAPRILLAPEDAKERAEAIGVVLAAIAERNDSKDFSAGGVPRATTVSAALGWTVDQTEIRPLWTAFKQEQNQK